MSGINVAGRKYVVGQDRNEPKAVAHLYAGTYDEMGDPMCVRGWNRGGGHDYSVFRGHRGGGVCAVCMKRAEAKRDPVPARDRKTKWL